MEELVRLQLLQDPAVVPACGGVRLEALLGAIGVWPIVPLRPVWSFLAIHVPGSVGVCPRNPRLNSDQVDRGPQQLGQ